MDSNKRKIYIRGLSWNTDEDLLRQHFSRYGEVLEVNVAREKATGRSKGFGFVVFSDPSVIDMILQENHQIDYREVNVKRFTSREERDPAGRSGNFDSKKIFVGGLPLSLTLEEFRAYFETYGPMSDAVITIDLTTQPPRVYGSVYFYSEDSVDRVLQKTFHYLNGNPVKVQRFFPKYANPGVDSGGGGTGVLLGNGGAGAASGGGEAGAASGSNGAGAASGGGDGAGAASGGGGAGAFRVYGGSGGSGYEGHMDSNSGSGYELQNTGSGYYPPYGAFGYGYAGYGWYGYPTYGASGYGYGSYGVGYEGLDAYGGYPAGAPYGDPGVPGASDPSSSRGAQVPLDYGNVENGAAAPCSAGPGSAVIEQIGGSGGNGNHQANNEHDVIMEVIQNMLWWKACTGQLRRS